MTEAEAIRLTWRALGAIAVIVVAFLALVGAATMWDLFRRRRER